MGTVFSESPELPKGRMKRTMSLHPQRKEPILDVSRTAGCFPAFFW
jgi:hypothetical protein